MKVTKHYRIAAGKVYSCEFCGTHISPTSDTVFHKSDTSLRSWFYAIFLMASTRTRISAKQLERELGVTYKRAWRMFAQIRKLMAEDAGPLFGQVEVDETCLRDKRHRKRGRGAEGKTIVVGIAQRNGRAMAKVVPDVKAKPFIPMVLKSVPVSKATTVFTDELPSYNDLPKLRCAHEVVQHAAKQYVNGSAHVNNIESLWSHIKRGISGGQPLPGAGKFSFVALALAAGYAAAYDFQELEPFETSLPQILKQPGPALICLQVPPLKERPPYPIVQTASILSRFRESLAKAKT